MTTEKEQEAFGLVIERHKTSASEKRHPSRLSTLYGNSRSRKPSPRQQPKGRRGSATLAGWTSTSTTPALSSKRTSCGTDYRFRDYIEQLDGYLESLLKAGTGVRNGILTDGINYFLRRVGEEKLPLATASSDEHLRPRRTGIPPAG